MTIDKQTIINMALTDIGAGPMFSTDDGSELAEQVEICWTAVVDRAFGLTDWTFARKTYRLTRQSATPENGWRYGFDLPGNRIGPPLKIMDQAGANPRPLRHYDIEEGILFCNEPDTWARVKVAVSPDVWDPVFRAAFVLALGGYLMVPVWQDEDGRASRLQEAFGTPSQGGTGGAFGRLVAQDKAAAPIGSPQEHDGPLIEARQTGAGRDLPWHGRF